MEDPEDLAEPRAVHIAGRDIMALGHGQAESFHASAIWSGFSLTKAMVASRTGALSSATRLSRSVRSQVTPVCGSHVRIEVSLENHW